MSFYLKLKSFNQKAITYIMKEINLTSFDNEFFLHYGGENFINVKTLTNSLESFIEAAEEINRIINPGYELRVEVHTISSGSVRINLKPLYKVVHNLFSKNALKAVVCSVIASFIYDSLNGEDVKIVVADTQVVIERGDERIIVPKEAYELKPLASKSEKFKRNLQKTFSVVEEDENIESFGLIGTQEGKEPSFIVPREKFPIFTKDATETVYKSYLEVTNLEITRAILEESNRKWEFLWNNTKISAPILDKDFFEKFSDHHIMIAPGDMLKVRMRIHQTVDNKTGNFVNERYEIEDVLKHFSMPRQTKLDF